MQDTLFVLIRDEFNVKIAVLKDNLGSILWIVTDARDWDAAGLTEGCS